MDESLIEKQNGNFANTVLGAVPSVVYNEDCVEGLKRFSDNYFDLAIVDPPYGIGVDGVNIFANLGRPCKYGKK
jgi:DNA modification methylase